MFYYGWKHTLNPSTSFENAALFLIGVIYEKVTKENRFSVERQALRFVLFFLSDSEVDGGISKLHFFFWNLLVLSIIVTITGYYYYWCYCYELGARTNTALHKSDNFNPFMLCSLNRKYSLDVPTQLYSHSHQCELERFEVLTAVKMSM
jgi:hypothetical protein